MRPVYLQFLDESELLETLELLPVFEDLPELFAFPALFVPELLELFVALEDLFLLLILLHHPFSPSMCRNSEFIQEKINWTDFKICLKSYLFSNS